METPNRVGNAAKSCEEHTQPAGNISEGAGGNLASTPRREFSARTREQAWERANGFCEGIVDGKRCNAPLHLPGASFHYDHIDPDWFSKNRELENCQLLCVPCHKAKTGVDKKNISKSKRVIRKRIKAIKKKRGFAGWRKFNGEQVWSSRR